MITVAIDCEHTRQSRGGTTRYSEALIEALNAHSGVNAVRLGGGMLQQRGTLRQKLTTARQDFLWFPFLGRRRARAAGADVYHCPIPRAPLTRGKIPLVVTVHDLVPVLFPETMTSWSRQYSRATFRFVLRAADVIIVPSQDTANDLNRLMGVSAERIRVVWNGAADIFFSEQHTARPIAEPYVLFVGTPEPRKNLPRLVAAMEELGRRGSVYRLAIAGSGGWGRVSVPGSSAEFLGHVEDTKLYALYQHAECVVLPSLHEGFGLPAAEAMAVGTPVVAANRGALPEVVDSSAILVDPEDTHSIADGIQQARADRARLVSLGKARAESFTWKNAAESTLEVYKTVLGKVS